MSMCPITGSNTRIINRSYESAEKARPLSTDPNHIYNQIGCNQFINIAKSSSDGLRPNSPLYSEITTNERNASNFYQLYKTPNDMNLKPNQLKIPKTFMR